MTLKLLQTILNTLILHRQSILYPMFQTSLCHSPAKSVVSSLLAGHHNTSVYASTVCLINPSPSSLHASCQQ